MPKHYEFRVTLNESNGAFWKNSMALPTEVKNMVLKALLDQGVPLNDITVTLTSFKSSRELPTSLAECLRDEEQDRIVESALDDLVIEIAHRK